MSCVVLGCCWFLCLQVSRLQVAELVTAAVLNPELAENKCLEVVAETTAPTMALEALLEQADTEITKVCMWGWGCFWERGARGRGGGGDSTSNGPGGTAGAGRHWNYKGMLGQGAKRGRRQLQRRPCRQNLGRQQLQQ